MGGAVPALRRGASRPVACPCMFGASGDAGRAWHCAPLLAAWVLGAGHGVYLRACSRWPPRLRCRGGGHPVRSPWGSYANGTCGVVHPAGLEPACPWATPFEGVVYPGSTTDACSPCLLVKGTDCAGVILARLRGWWSRSLVPVLGTSPLDGQSPHRAMFAYPCSGKTTVGRLVGCM